MRSPGKKGARFHGVIRAEAIDVPGLEVRPPAPAGFAIGAVQFRRNRVNAAARIAQGLHIASGEPRTIEFVRPHDFGRDFKALRNRFTAVADPGSEADTGAIGLLANAALRSAGRLRFEQLEVEIKRRGTESSLFH